MSSRVDWVQLTEGATVVSLWESLHDGKLTNIVSDLYERTVRLVCDVYYLRSFHNLPDDLKFNLQLEGVKSARVTKWAAWPGEFSVPEGTGRSEEQRLVDEYWAKFREESESWTAFEAVIANDRPEIQNATLAIGERDSGVALKVEVMLESSFHELFLSADRLSLSRSDHAPFDLEQFLQLGSSYWEHFERRSQKVTR